MWVQRHKTEPCWRFLWEHSWADSAANAKTLILPVETKSPNMTVIISVPWAVGLENLLQPCGWVGQGCSRLTLTPFSSTASSRCNVIKEWRKHFVSCSVTVHDYTLKLLNCARLISVPGLLCWPGFMRCIETETTTPLKCQSTKRTGILSPTYQGQSTQIIREADQILCHFFLCQGRHC